MFMKMFEIQKTHVCHGCQIRGDQSPKDVMLTDLFERPESNPFALCVKCFNRLIKGQFEELGAKPEPATPLFERANNH